jgi:hypothetical protein
VGSVKSSTLGSFTQKRKVQSPSPAIALRGNAVVCRNSEDPVGHFADGRNLDSQPHGTFTKSKMRYNSAVAFTIPVYEIGSAIHCREQLGS